MLLPRLGRPDARAALRLGDRVVSYAELGAACARHAAGLADRGIRAGDRVAVITSPTLEHVVALVGNALAGVVTVPLSPSLGATARAHIEADARPALVLEGALDGVARGAAGPRPVDDAPLLVLYTSGTTGPPKGAVLTARNVAANLDALAVTWGWTADDTVVHALPLFHVHGLVLGLLGSLRVGGALWWIPRFETGSIAAALAGDATMLFAVPTMLHRLADAAETDDRVARGLAAARLLVSGSAGLPVREHRRVEALTGRSVHERYGLTETLIVCGVPAAGPGRPGWVGPPLPSVEVRVVGEDGAEVARDGSAIGEVQVRGPSVFAGYLNRPEATAEAMDDGWFRTGDLAARAVDGALRILGRRSTDLIKTGGYKVGAGAVEACLLEVPGVAEVAVVGVPDEDLGERIVAFVVAREPGSPPDPGVLIDRVAAELSPHERPRQVRFVDALPRNAMGKVQKRALRDG